MVTEAAEVGVSFIAVTGDRKSWSILLGSLIGCHIDLFLLQFAAKNGTEIMTTPLE